MGIDDVVAAVREALEPNWQENDRQLRALKRAIDDLERKLSNIETMVRQLRR